jgi:hypothetical protein
MQKHGCQQLQVDFHYNEIDNTIEVSYFYGSGVLEGNHVVMEPHGGILRYRRKQGGRNSTIDSIFDDPKRMAEVTKQAEQYFSRIIGWTMDKTIQLAIHQALFHAGLKFKGSATQMAKVLANANRRDLSEELGVKRGAPKGKKQSSLRFSKATVEVEMSRKIRQLRRQLDRDPTRLEGSSMQIQE